MSSSTWTPAALSSEARPLSGTCWRLVEAQHRVSTLKLVDTVEEQSVLEDLIQDTKPVLPAECAHLHYLLSTPFRYGAAYPVGSRFRRAGLTEGVFYAAEEPHTAVAEIVFYRLLFYAESPGTPWPQNAAEYTAFSAAYATKKGIDLTAGKLQRDKALWIHLTDYEPCQRLAEFIAFGERRCHSLPVGARSAAWFQSRLADLPRLHEAQAGPRADLAHSTE